MTITAETSEHCKRMSRLLGQKKTKEEAYRAGYDSVVHGANLGNCQFAFFASRQLTKAWERGRKAARNNLS